MIDDQMWRGKVARYRKHEQRHDRTTNAGSRAVDAKLMATFYVDLSNEARKIVLDAGRNSCSVFTDVINSTQGETITTVQGLVNYRIKRKHEDPERLWFQHFDHEPWFDLGYINASGEFQDTRPTGRIAVSNPHVTGGGGSPGTDFKIGTLGAGATVPSYHSPSITGRALDWRPNMQDTINLFVKASHASWPADWTELGYTQEGHEFTFTRDTHATEGTTIDMNVTNDTNPDDLEAAATHALAEAARLRALDALEPDGDEPTISWTWEPDYENATPYTYVAFKANNGRWYTTGAGRNYLCGISWRELVTNSHSENVRNGNFHVVTEWEYQGTGDGESE